MKKSRVILGLFTVINLFNQTFPQKIDSQKKQDKRGRDRVFTIMYDGDYGIKNYNKNITYAETNNLVEDIVIPQVALYFPTKTDLGQTFLLDTLSFSVSPKDTNSTVLRRETVIKNLNKNEEFQQKVNLLLEQAKNVEADVMKLMVNRDKALEKIKLPDLSHLGVFEYLVKPWYVASQYIEQNPWINSVNQVRKVTQASALAGLSAKQAQMAYNIAQDPNFEIINTKDTQNYHKIMGINNPNNVDTNHQSTENEKLEATIDYFQNQKVWTPEAKKLATLGIAAYVAGETAINTSKSIYNDYQKGLDNRNLIYALAQLIIIAEKLQALCSQHGLDTQFKPSLISDPQGLVMIAGLKHARYQEKASSFVATPWVNTFINEIYEQDIYLAPFFALIAEMDAYNAIAKKMIETANTPNQFCFAHILQHNRPKIQADGFWNVVVAQPVANSFEEDRSIIFTGANAGGKSTAMRSILQNIVLSQTFGIATGKQFASTPFDVINSYLHITDDVEKGLSRYASELKNANNIVTRAKTLRPDEKFFFVIDELFTGTGGKEGETLAYEFINNDLAPYLEKTQFIFATHFDKLKEIEKANPTQFANYKVNAPTVNSQGKLIYPFTISKGVNNINIAALMKKEAGLLGNVTAPAA